MSVEVKKRKNRKELDNDKTFMKDEKAVAKYLRFNCQTRKASLVGNKVDYFVGSKAIDSLMSSKWAPTLFDSRDTCVDYLQNLLNKEFFHRAEKVFKEDDDESKRKFKLEMHDDQIFLDSNDPYVWIYDPATLKSLTIGSLLVIGTIAGCLFPLWPPIFHEYLHYLSLIALALIGVLVSLMIFKYILFALVWLFTFGKKRFWLLPNLSEDVGFFESFKPLYKVIEASEDLNKKTKTN
jgi:translocation protein SEC62